MASTETLRHNGAERLVGSAGIPRAAQILRAGGLVAFPTETVYGLGADATNGEAVARIYEAKGRPSFNPLIVHVADLSAAEGLAVFDDTARRLAQAFWPGPLTLVLPIRPQARLSGLVTAGLSTVGVRVPAAPFARDLLARAGCPVAAPSANPSGRISPTRADHVLEMLGDRVDAVLDGGASAVGVESTILRPEPLTLLREGGVPVEEITALLGTPPDRDTTPGRVNAPGQLASHYAPRLPVRLNITAAGPDTFLIGFGSVGGALSLSPGGNLREAAAALFETLHRADAMAAAEGRSEIGVAPIPVEGLGRAINDRLMRAAAPR